MDKANIFNKRYIVFFAFINFFFNNAIIAGGFVAGTPVLTPNGFVPIEQIKVGDKVTCRSYWNSCETIGTVAATRKKTVNQIAKIGIEHESVLETTLDQQFWHLLFGWRASKELQASEEIFPLADCFLNGLATPPPGLSYQEKSEFYKKKPPCVRAKEMLNKTTEVYDLHVKYHYHYIVTKHNIMAHNFFPPVLACVAWFAANYEFFLTIAILPFLIPHILKKLTNKEARQWADGNGWVEDKNPPKKVIDDLTGHGKPPVFKDPNANRWISPDQDNHGGGVWKEFGRSGRTGTLDKDLNKIRK
ncbi:hypothetical protein HYX58_04635 [Candidatus Dependentiae bacterium]|nr:hypothetical protein [Candidatus Dependentiae bacterium]